MLLFSGEPDADRCSHITLIQLCLSPYVHHLCLWLVWELRMTAHVRLINRFRRANYGNASSLVSHQEIYLGNKLLTKAITQTRRVDEYLHLGVEWFQTAACQPVVFSLLQRLICDCIWTGRLLRVTGALGSWTVRKRKSDQIWCHEENSASRRRGEL